MNLRKAGSYHIGLDLGTGSVGWCVVDDNGDLFHIKGKPTWGSRLFPSASTAAETRVKRGQRRRYERRRQRLDCLQEIFAPEINEVDPEFFCRMRQSSLLAEDRDPAHPTDYHHPFFNGTDFTESAYYQRFPTIYHLRKYLMECDEQADIRLIYLALHNIVKYRGNFLHEDEAGLSAKGADAEEAALNLAIALETYAEEAAEAHGGELSCQVDVQALKDALDERGLSRAARAERIQGALGLSDRSRAKAAARACVGYKVEYASLFFGLEKQEGTAFELSNDEKVDAFAALCPEEAAPVFEALQAAYSAYVLADILKGEDSLSAAMVESYEQHKADLTLLKGLVRDHLDMDAYRKLFRGPKDERGEYDINKLPAKSYTAYIAGEQLANKKGCSQEDLIKNIRKLCESSPALMADPRFATIKDRLYADDGEFLAKQKTRANGAIPYQLHLEEMDRIIQNQGRYHPFLLENRELLEKLVSSRIPYYVGPLNGGEGGQGRKFAWSVRKPGMEHAEAHPWNVEEVIDTDETAERFIMRMTGTCTYLYGEPVLPRHSLIYEEFCVLNELNGARWAAPGRDPKRFDARDREDLMDELFRRRKTVSHKAVTDWLERRNGTVDARITGTQGEAAFESKLESYNDFCKILDVPRLDDPACPLTTEEIEQIILWSTIFEDRDILKRKLAAAFGEKLTAKQINQLVKKRYTGWGRLSRKFLCELKVQTGWGAMSIMDILREGDPLPGHHARAMNLMETLHEDAFGFEALVDEENRKRFGEDGNTLSVNDLPGSPALRRTVNQAMAIVEELAGIAGHAPSSIVIEVTRDDDPRKKGRRTTTRYNRLKEAFAAYRQDARDFDPGLLKELDARKDALDDDRLMLYFAQGGKCLYSGETLDIRRLSSYHIDHILPQAYIKDDSLDNRALVKSELNERKLDSLLLPSDIVRARRRWWGELHEAGLMSDKKYRNLTRTSVGENALKGFIARQLVETSQVVKFVRQMCEQRYPATEVVSLKASLSHGVRERCDFAKCRELNDFHHAHDAYLACQVSRFVSLRYPQWQDGFQAAVLKKYVESLAESNQKTGRYDYGSSGFIVDSFMRDGVGPETGEVWEAAVEVARIGRTLDIKQCFISRMTKEQTGAFWDETLYSPRDAKHKPQSLVPQKGFGTEGALDPAKYGGFDNPKRAYFFIFRAHDKKGRAKYFFEGVPIHLLSQAAESSEALTAYAEGIANAAKCSGAQVLRARVPLRQKFELDGTEYYLGGRTGASNWIRPATELAGDRVISALAYKVLGKPESATDEEFSCLYDFIAANLEKTCPRIFQLINLPAYRSVFCSLEPAGKASIIRNALAAANGNSFGCNITLIGGKANAGTMAVAFGSRIPDITWIDVSVTGIFEQRTTLKDMCDGL